MVYLVWQPVAGLVYIKIWRVIYTKYITKIDRGCRGLKVVYRRVLRRALPIHFSDTFAV